ncbi:DUF6463 family protein [Streptosporangium algeriense]|uniref:DUF6463 family protein n=1 Tax=Streptosporangium algeriense TaxID=1682748 RepID=A0ABW3DV68_9ACTN
MNSRKRMLRWASGIMIVLGAGHLSVVVLTGWAQVADWARRGLWAAVPFFGAGGDAVQPLETLRDKAVFWAGPGSFAVPLILLGCLTWHLAGRGVAVPAGIGWGVAVWSVLGGVLLVPSPFFAGAVAGTLIVLAARKEDRPGRNGLETPQA